MARPSTIWARQARADAWKDGAVTWVFSQQVGGDSCAPVAARPCFLTQPCRPLPPRMPCPPTPHRGTTDSLPGTCRCGQKCGCEGSHAHLQHPHLKPSGPRTTFMTSSCQSFVTEWNEYIRNRHTSSQGAPLQDTAAGAGQCKGRRGSQVITRQKNIVCPLNSSSVSGAPSEIFRILEIGFGTGPNLPYYKRLGGRNLMVSFSQG